MHTPRRASFLAKRNLLPYLMLAGAACTVWITAHASENSTRHADLSPHRLRCEYLVNPLGIDEAQPRLSWGLESGTRDEKQSAYQIIVATSPKLLASDQGDLWDTGRTQSTETIHLPYAGRPLESSQQVWWKVRSWNQDGVAGPWSEPARWEMGILDPAEWTAEWIGLDDDTAHGKPLPVLRKSFDLSKDVRRATLYVCGLGYAEVYLNGSRVGDSRLSPGYTRYDRRVLYETFDVTDMLGGPENAIGVMLGNGWFNVATRAPWNFDKAPWRASPRMICQLRVEYADGSIETIASDDTWKVARGPITLSSIYGGEAYDARLEQLGWSEFDFDDSEWQPAKVLDPPGGRLVAAKLPPVRFTHEFEPQSVRSVAENVQLIDFGQNMAGCVELTASGPAGSEIEIVYSELLGDDGRLARQNIGCHVWSHGDKQRFQTDSYVLQGEGEETWHARFTYHGFRYVEVKADAEVLKNIRLKAHSMHTDMQPVGSFACSNDLLNKVWQAACWSYLNNYVSIPTDCPHREKNGWTGDAHLACEFGLLNFDGAAAYTKWINDLADEQQPDGVLPGIVPTSGWGYEWGNGPAWDSAYTLIPDYMRVYCGDTRLLDRQYDGHRRYVDYLTGASEDLIIKFGLGDWAPWKTQTPADLTSTAYFYRNAQIVAATAARLGDVAAASRYSELAAGIHDAFQREYWNESAGRYEPATQTSLSCALYQGLVAPEHQAAVVAQLLAKLEETDHHIDTGILGAKYLPNALSDFGQTEAAYRVASQDTQPSWGWWIEQGATTLWEQWTTADSHNHIMYGDIAAWFTKELAGLKPDSERTGFANVLINPHPVGDLTWARATHDSLRGPIKVDWRRENGKFHLEVELPANVTATVQLPTTDASKIQESGKPLEQSNGVVLVNTAQERAELQLQSGKYVLDAPYVTSSVR